MIDGVRTVTVTAVVAWLLGAALSAAEPMPTGRLVEGVRCRTDPSQSYTLYLPSAYSQEHRWPVLLVFDPRGRSRLAAELFRDAAERFGWIVLSSDNTRSDGPWEPNVRAVDAMWPDATTRYAADPDRMYAAGFSGGAHVAWLLAESRARLAGVIACGGRYDPSFFRETRGFAHFGAAGSTDFNYRGMEAVDALLDERGQLHRFEVFQGRHEWMPKETAGRAVAWLEVVAMRRGLRPVDEELVQELMSSDLEEARASGASGHRLEAVRTLSSVVETYEGLADVTSAREHAARMADSAEAARAVRERDRLARWEERSLQRIHAALARFEDPETAVPPGRLRHDMRVDDLLDAAAAGGARGLAAQRVLNAAYALTAFYRPRDLFGRGLYAQAETMLEVAVGIDGSRPSAWYDLACARARQGHVDAAFDALRRAVGAGFTNAALLARDPDLEGLRGDERFAAIAASASARAAADRP